jgi:CTP:molybdopterin cytidylyltransferase MocA
MDGVLLAGGIPAPDDPLHAAAQGRPKSLIDVAGRPMGQWVLDALDAAPSVERVLIVGLDAEAGLTSPKVVGHVPDRGSLLANTLAGVAWLQRRAPEADLLLACCADIPLMTADMVEALVVRCADPSVDIYYGFASRTRLEQRFPGSRRSYVRMREDALAGGDVHVIAPRIAEAHRALWEDLLRTRKTALRQALRLGPVFLLRLLLHRLSVPEAERRVHQKFGLTVRALEVPPEMAMDVDKPFQLALCRRHLDRHGGPDR